MTDHSASSSALAWVHKRDGRLVPFDADKISRALFNAASAIGHPDAFLARELTDAVLHFLETEFVAAIPTTEQVRETVGKVVRELGQPALAHAFAEGVGHKSVPAAAETSRTGGGETPRSDDLEVAACVESAPGAAQLRQHLARLALRSYSLRSVFGPDLVAAHEEGLLVLGQLEAPLELSACVLSTEPNDSRGVLELVQAAADTTGDTLVIDGPEYLLCGEKPRLRECDYVHQLTLGLRASGLRAVVNVNSLQPPSWASELAEGPLFVEQGRSCDEQERTTVVASLVDELVRTADPSRVDYHLAEVDFQLGRMPALGQVVRRAVEGAPIAFVFDRPRRPVALAEGIDRAHPAALLTVGLNLPRFAQMPGLAGNATLFLQKLGSLVRIAFAAAAQKRDFLRRHSEVRPALGRGFLLDRARLVVAPVGLEAVTRTFAGAELAGDGLEFARQVVQRLRGVLRHDGQGRHLAACLDAPADFHLRADRTPDTLPVDQVAGLTPWDATAAPKPLLRAAGLLHAAEAGTAALLLPSERSPTADEIIALLRYASQRTDLVRLRLVRTAPPRRQLQAPWAE